MNILIVDDSKSIRLLLTQCIESLGHDVTTVANGEQCMEVLQSNKIDLVFMDIEMPGMDGFATTRSIRKEIQVDWFPIIFLSSKLDDQSFEKGINAGGDAYLTKPFNEIRLKAQLVAMERIYQMRQQLQSAQRQLLKNNVLLTQLSLFDELTTLANRRNFDNSLEKEFKRALREKNSLVLIICDIDCFKLYNDNYGHIQGDQCLKQVAKAMKSVPNRAGDLICRYGGEEFCTILPNTDLQGGKTIAERLRQAVLSAQIPHAKSKVDRYVTLSLGVAVYNGQYKTTDELIQAADNALYQAKDNGRNQVVG